MCCRTCCPVGYDKLVRWFVCRIWDSGFRGSSGRFSGSALLFSSRTSHSSSSSSRRNPSVSSDSFLSTLSSPSFIYCWIYFRCSPDHKLRARIERLPRNGVRWYWGYRWLWIWGWLGSWVWSEWYRVTFCCRDRGRRRDWGKISHSWVIRTCGGRLWNWSSVIITINNQLYESVDRLGSFQDYYKEASSKKSTY